MSADKYPSIFSRQIEAIVYIYMYIGQTFFIPAGLGYLNRRRQSIVFTNMCYSCINSLGCVDLKTKFVCNPKCSVHETTC